MTAFQEKVLREIAAGRNPYAISRTAPGISKAINNLVSSGALAYEPNLIGGLPLLTEKGRKFCGIAPANDGEPRS